MSKADKLITSTIERVNGNYRTHFNLYVCFVTVTISARCTR